MEQILKERLYDLVKTWRRVEQRIPLDAPVPPYEDGEASAFGRAADQLEAAMKDADKFIDARCQDGIHKDRCLIECECSCHLNLMNKEWKP